jgi:hypothetical protein
MNRTMEVQVSLGVMVHLGAVDVVDVVAKRNAGENKQGQSNTELHFNRQSPTQACHVNEDVCVATSEATLHTNNQKRTSHNHQPQPPTKHTRTRRNGVWAQYGRRFRRLRQPMCCCCLPLDLFACLTPQQRTKDRKWNHRPTAQLSIHPTHSTSLTGLARMVQGSTTKRSSSLT